MPKNRLVVLVFSKVRLGNPKLKVAELTVETPASTAPKGSEACVSRNIATIHLFTSEVTPGAASEDPAIFQHSRIAHCPDVPERPFVDVNIEVYPLGSAGTVDEA